MSLANDISILPDEQVQLWQRFKAGDSEALGKLAQVHYRALYNYGSRFSTDGEFVRDTIQDLYLELWERRAFLSETAFVKSYLLKALRHKLIKEAVKLRRFQEPQQVHFDVAFSDPPIESNIIEDEHLLDRSNRLNHSMKLLSKRQQEIIYLRFYQNLENEDIAGIMGLGRQSVANLLYRTLRELREIWVPAEFFWMLPGCCSILFC